MTDSSVVCAVMHRPGLLPSGVCLSPSSRCSASNSSHLKSSSRTILEPLELCHPDAPKANSQNLMLSPWEPASSDWGAGIWELSRFKAAQTCQCNLQARTPCRVRPRPGLHLKLRLLLGFFVCFLILLPCSLVGLPLEDTSFINHLHTHVFLRTCFWGIQGLSCL